MKSKTLKAIRLVQAAQANNVIILPVKKHLSPLTKKILAVKAAS